VAGRIARALLVIFFLCVVGAALAPTLAVVVGNLVENITAQGGPTALAGPFIAFMLGPVFWLVVGILIVVGFVIVVFELKDRT
jgi:hypothetical protein